jgi:hypothetical protein
MRQNVHAILLVVMLQLLTVETAYNGWGSRGHWERHAMKISVGFPVNCMSYTFVRVTGDLPNWVNYPDRNEWLSGFRVSSVFCALDALYALAAFFGFRWLLFYKAGRTISLGLVLGFFAGVIENFGEIESWQPMSGLIIAPLFLAGLPMIVCLFTRAFRSVWSSLLMLTVALFVMPWVCLRAEHFRGYHVVNSWDEILLDMLLMPLGCIVILIIPVLVVRRFVPFCRRHEEQVFKESTADDLKGRPAQKPSPVFGVSLAIIISLFSLALAIPHFSAQMRVVRQLDTSYQKVERGMASGDVFGIMNQDGFAMVGKDSDENMSGWWDNTALDARDKARIQSAIIYTAQEFFRTIKYVFTFDENKKLVGKHKFS